MKIYTSKNIPLKTSKMSMNDKKHTGHRLLYSNREKSLNFSCEISDYVYSIGRQKKVPRWWNGRHDGLKIHCLCGCESSSLSRGTKNTSICSL